jgi:hypothetical protein
MADNVQIVAEPFSLASAGSNSNYEPFTGYHNGRAGGGDGYGPFEGWARGASIRGGT